MFEIREWKDDGTYTLFKTNSWICATAHLQHISRSNPDKTFSIFKRRK